MPIRKHGSASGAKAPADHEGSKVYEMVTKRILQTMMRGEIPWRNIWTARGKKHPYTNYVTGRPYQSLLNMMLLGEPGEYATMNQINVRGGHLQKGSKGKLVIYWGEYIPKDRKEEAKRLKEEGKDFSHLKVHFPKYYYVYNVKDAVGLKPKEEAAPETVAAEDPTDIVRMAVDDYTVNEQVRIETAADTPPSYSAVTDTVTMPDKNDFTFEEDYYASLCEQLVHSTAAEGRCDRKKEYGRLQDGEMSVKEELIAEIGASMILTVAGMKRSETHEQLAAVCQRWIEEFNRDYRLVVNASSGAEKAAKLILGQFAA